jgi:hypothetical protein
MHGQKRAAVTFNKEGKMDGLYTEWDKQGNITNILIFLGSILIVVPTYSVTVLCVMVGATS